MTDTSLEGRVVVKLWGHERILVNDEAKNHCEKVLTVLRGRRCSIHYHPVKDEEFEMLTGRMLVEIEIEPYPQREDNKTKGLRYLVMKPGDKLRVRPNTAHRFTGLAEKSEFREVSTYDRPEDSIRITESGVVPAREFESTMRVYGQ